MALGHPSPPPVRAGGMLFSQREKGVNPLSLLKGRHSRRQIGCASHGMHGCKANRVRRPALPLIHFTDSPQVIQSIKIAVTKYSVAQWTTTCTTLS